MKYRLKKEVYMNIHTISKENNKAIVENDMSVADGKR